MIWCARQFVRTLQTTFQSNNVWMHRSAPVRISCIGSASHHVSTTPVFRLTQELTFGTLLCNKFILMQRQSRHTMKYHEILRRYSTIQEKTRKINVSVMLYITAVAIVVLGMSYAAVPLYRLFCQATGYGGTVYVVTDTEKVEAMKPVKERELTIKFNADTSPKLRWKFKPHQSEIMVVPGETALAFYSATNLTDRPITGIATYNVIPFEAGQYFHKVQCFCFEEQRLNPNEQVDMPVFFYIDPEFDDDPAVVKIDTIMLSYTFFESLEGEESLLPSYDNSIIKSPA
ncbi:cytochrome c oxidase assembly protein ctaG-like [Dysidea avara]|uniref:cytochrome c oxidase assembly protein ctaG-like n=1 Tax=Dysidea avara TaxID=196820 RepID=UPI00332B3731